MKSYFQRLGRSLMLPVSVLPAAAILIGIGNLIGNESILASFLIEGGSSIIDAMGILFAVGVALGMSENHDGSAALSALVAWLITTKILAPDSLAILQNITIEAVNPAFDHIETQFIGILSGLVAATLYNRFHNIKLPRTLAFFGGKRFIPIATSVVMMGVSLLLMFIWPVIYNLLISFGKLISSFGAFGAGLFGFFNRILIPTGLHHALNSVFWFNIAGINDIGNFWNNTGTLGITGIYQAGFFPIMMFGLPAGALAIASMADKNQKNTTKSLMIAAAFTSFFTGITEPLEFAFMFAAPILYITHAIITGFSLFIAASFQWIAGFTFSAGLIDYLLSFNLPLAKKPAFLILQGFLFAAIYFFSFRFLIKKFDLKTPGRGKINNEQTVNLDDNIITKDINKNNYYAQAKIILAGLGGAQNVRTVDNCATRLRLEINDINKVNNERIKLANILGINKINNKNIQIVVGTEVQFIADEIIKIMKEVK